jgi:DNA-binding NarL/FixJ family response regulator
MFVEGLSASINKSGRAVVASVSYTLNECRKALAFTPVDVLLLDISLPDGNGIDFCKEIHVGHPDLKILILTSHNEYSIAKRTMENGASGYILKNALSEEVIEGIEAVMNGETFLCDEIDTLIHKKSEQQIWLTNREQEVLELISEGFTNQKIADALFLSIETVKTYRKNLIQKFDAKNTVALVRKGMENKLV